jgi:uncharacterized protein YndB with AHSA1/START domain
MLNGRKEPAMRANTQSITIEASPADVFACVADLEQLPRWAIGFAKDVRREDGRWYVRTGSGDELEVRARTSPEHGVVDYLMSPHPGVEVPAATRVVPNGDGAEYVFTMFQPPGMPDPLFEQQAAELGRELIVLKAHLESSCPL